MTSVTILVPAHNEAEHIEATVRAAVEQSRPADRVLVVADACTDNTADIARAAGAEVIEASCGRKAGAQNVGLNVIDTDLIVGVDADTQLAPDALQIMVEHLEATGADGTCATVLPLQRGGLFVRSRRFEYALARAWWKWAQAQVGRVYVLSGCGFAIRTEALRAIGGFSDRHISEDTHTTWQLYRAGFKLTYTPAALSYSLEPETLASYRGQIRRWSAGSFQVMAEYWREFRRPTVLLVVGTALLDLVLLPITYVSAAVLASRSPAFRGILLAVMVAWFAITLTLVARVVGWREALACFVPHKIVSPINRFTYAWAMVRELVLGRHYGSWTGRQGRAKVITPMSPLRRRVFASGATSGVLVAGLVVVLSLSAPAVVRPDFVKLPFSSAAQPSPAGSAPSVELQAGFVAADVLGTRIPEVTQKVSQPKARVVHREARAVQREGSGTSVSLAHRLPQPRAAATGPALKEPASSERERAPLPSTTTSTSTTSTTTPVTTPTSVPTPATTPTTVVEEPVTTPTTVVEEPVTTTTTIESSPVETREDGE